MIYFIILTANILALYFIRSDKKYWVLAIPLWVLLVSGFICWRIFNDKRIETLETEYWKTTENRGYGNHDKFIKLGEVKEQAQKLNMTLVNLIGLQAFIAFILQIVGHRRTTLLTYRWTKVIFGIIFILLLLLITMMRIVPSTGYVT